MLFVSNVRRSLRYWLAAGMAVVPLNCGEPKKSIIPAADSGSWQRIDLADLEETDFIATDSDSLALFWADDASTIAWYTMLLPDPDAVTVDHTELEVLWDEDVSNRADVVGMYDRRTKQQREIRPDGRLRYTASGWRRSHPHLLLGVARHRYTDRITGEPPHVDALIEYDVRTGEVVRELSSDQFGGFPTNAEYSRDGTRLLVATQPASPSIMQIARGSKLFIVEEDGTVITLRRGQEALPIYQWDGRGRGLIGDTTEYRHWSVFGFELYSGERDYLSFISADDPDAKVKRLAPLSGFFPQFMGYDSDGGVVRYEIQTEDAQEVLKQWELWEYSFKTNRRTRLFDLLALLSKSISEPVNWTTLKFPPLQKDLVFAYVITAQHPLHQLWYIDLRNARYGRISLGGAEAISEIAPNGRSIACVGEDGIHIYDLNLARRSDDSSTQ